MLQPCMFSCVMHTAAHRLSVYLPTRIVKSRKGRILKHKTVSAETQSSSSDLKSSHLRQSCQYVTLYWSLQAAARYEIRAVLWIYSSKTQLFSSIIRHRTLQSHLYYPHECANTFLLPRAFSFYSCLLAYYQCVAGQGNRRHTGAAACV